MKMTDFLRKSFNQPDEIQKVPLLKMDIINIGHWNLGSRPAVIVAKPRFRLYNKDRICKGVC